MSSSEETGGLWTGGYTSIRVVSWTPHTFQRFYFPVFMYDKGQGHAVHRWPHKHLHTNTGVSISTHLCPISAPLYTFHWLIRINMNLSLFHSLTPQDHPSLPGNNSSLTVAVRLRNVTDFLEQNIWKSQAGQTHQITLHKYGQGQRDKCVIAFTDTLNQLLCVKLLLSLIRQEAVPSDGLKTQEVDISMPGIPALCSLCRDKKD